MQELWLIDGYNLLHALRSEVSPKDAPSREKLFALAAEFASLKKYRTLLVLDGAGDPAQLEAYRTGCFEAVFSQKVSADTCIEKHLYEERGKARMTVVTNDRAIANIARGCGAAVMSASAFYGLLGECRREGEEWRQKEKSRGHRFNRPFEDKLKDHE